ncbi:hypothetical protein RclHR1_00180051 [Rhizophagus clarus]|uniref:Uncharacterized protein n=1 Tax=Rhizophagus clarus TaxID=94130 RepID=A0A2Z6QL47_9GLOM|nr:hypothetical protein RclHR1_00180051 [Rhizophagus clarus]
MVQEMVGRVKSIEARLVSSGLWSPRFSHLHHHIRQHATSTISSTFTEIASRFIFSINKGGAYRRPSIQKSKAFSMSINQMRPNAMSKVQ